MKMIPYILLFLGIGFLIPSCSVISPMILPTQTTFMIPADGYEILQGEEVEGSAIKYSFLLWAWGNGGLRAAYNDALSKHTYANSLINVKVDQEVFSILGIYNKYIVHVSGLPVRLFIKPSGKYPNMP